VQAFGDGALGAVQAGEEDAGRIADAVRHHGAVGQLEIEAERTKSPVTSSKVSASRINSSVGKPQCPSSIASVRA
jgi:hypothetical protein